MSDTEQPKSPKPSNPLREWMKREKYKAGHIAERFGVTEQTIHHWSSKGIPASRLDFVLRTISEWPASGYKGPVLYVQASSEQFKRWSNAWRNTEFESIEEWAAHGLDAIAKEYFTPALVDENNMAAENNDDLASLPRLGSTQYPKNKKRGNL